MVEPVYCVHCGAIAKHPVTKIIHNQTLNFCCGGCLQVYEMLHEEGLASEPVEAKTITGLPPGSLQNQIEAAQTITIPIVGMTCSNCVATVERSLLSVLGVLDVNVVLQSEQATIKIVPSMVSVTDLKHAVEDAGYEMPMEI